MRRVSATSNTDRRRTHSNLDEHAFGCLPTSESQCEVETLRVVLSMCVANVNVSRLRFVSSRIDVNHIGTVDEQSIVVAVFI
jgi:hypothetical protein